MSDERTQERSERLEMLAGLLAGFAHEIRNPLSTIGLNLQLIKEDFENAESARDRRTHKRLSVVEAEVERLQSILEEFMRFVRRPELRVKAIDLNELLEKLVELTMPEMAEKGVSVRFYPGADVGSVEVDPELLRSVIENLLRNAKEACARGDQVMVSSRRGDDRVIVQVIDTGEGMDPEVRDKVFTPYFSTKKSGSGLGLAIARRVVREHGGTIELSSERGRGTQFTIRLPVRFRAGHGEEHA